MIKLANTSVTNSAMLRSSWFCKLTCSTFYIWNKTIIVIKLFIFFYFSLMILFANYPWICSPSSKIIIKCQKTKYISNKKICWSNNCKSSYVNIKEVNQKCTRTYTKIENLNYWIVSIKKIIF